jgi:oligoribonuclease NrnB/cAMP/cGMP phosphodiesterase (DHH superfamily)
MPLFIKLIQDQDIGVWQYKDTIPFHLAIITLYKKKPTMANLHIWDKLFSNSHTNKIISKGYQYLPYYEHLIDVNLLQYTLEQFPSKSLYSKNKQAFDTPGQYIVALHCGNMPDTSILGNTFMKVLDCDFVMLWTYNNDTKHYVISFRSSEDKNVNVANIAKLFGGGGHPYASACRISSTEYRIDDLFEGSSMTR